MASRPAILVDLNVVLDVLQHRQPFYARSAQVLDAVSTGRAAGFLSAHSITTLCYVLQRHAGQPTAVHAIRRLLDAFTVATVDDAVIRAALDYGWADFEDAVQMAAAAAAGVDYLITRDARGFAHPVVPVLSPAALVAILAS